MQEKIINIHDKFFKASFGDVDVATDFLKNYLPAEVLKCINLNTVETQNCSFVDKTLKEQFSDLLFRADINNEEGYIYFLFEHKSYNDKLSILQLLRYMIEIWESKIDKEKEKKLPIIIPLLIYHDKNKWNAKTRLSDWVKGYKDISLEMRRYIPEYEYLLYDLSEYEEEQTRLDIRTKVVIEMLNRGRYASTEEAKQLILEAFKLLIEVRATEGTTNIVEACIRYLLGIRDDITEKELKEIGTRVTPKGGELVMTVADRLRQEGVEKGILEEKRKSAKTGIIKGYNIEIIMSMTGLTEEEIEEIRNEMLK